MGRSYFGSDARQRRGPMTAVFVGIALLVATLVSVFVWTTSLESGDAVTTAGISAKAERHSPTHTNATRIPRRIGVTQPPDSPPGRLEELPLLCTFHGISMERAWNFHGVWHARCVEFLRPKISRLYLKLKETVTLT